MDENIYTITLADGAVIENLRLNGNNFISNEQIEHNVFDGNCSPVVISNGEYEVFHENMKLVQISRINGEYWFVLRDISPDEIEKIKIQSDLEYVAMMTGVEL